MSRSDLARMYDEQVDALAGVLADLDEAEWEHPSLCSRWRVREVVAHLVAAHQSAPPAPVGRLLLRSGWSCSRIIDRAARQAARHRPDELLAQFRSLDRSRGVARFVPLDLRFAEPGRAHARRLRPSAPARVGPAHRLAATFKVLLAHRAFGLSVAALASGLQMSATDLSWSTGDGPEVRGSGQALVLALTGRPVGLERLHGYGVALLQARF